MVDRSVTVTDGYAGSVSECFGDVIFCLADTFRKVEAAGEEGCYSRRQRAARSVGIGGVNAARFEKNRSVVVLNSKIIDRHIGCLLYTSPSPRDRG